MIDFVETPAGATIPVRTDRRLGWKPELPDQRDHLFDHARVLRRLRQKLPYRVDLRELDLHRPVFDQGNLGSCVSNADGKAYQIVQRMQGLEDLMPSRLFNYYGAREIEGTIPWDDGCYIRDGFKVLNRLGAPHESLWPYNIGAFDDRPATAAYADGEQHQALEYQAVEVKTTAVKAALAAKHPVVIGFTVYSSFYDIQDGGDGFMKVPQPGEHVEGGHAVLCMGYGRMKAPWDRYAKDYGIYLNSWGESWGDGGFFYAPFGYMCDRRNADDFWTVLRAEG